MTDNAAWPHHEIGKELNTRADDCETVGVWEFFSDRRKVTEGVGSPLSPVATK